jgi:lycopene beta-cyclase
VGADVDLLVVGDGPAGLALAAACTRVGVDVAVVGPGAPWTPTYGTWVTPRLGEYVDALGWQGEVAAWGNRRHVLQVPYGVFDNELLRRHLLDGVDVRTGRVAGVIHRVDHSVATLDDGGTVTARLVMDATGPDSAGGTVPMQTAYGLVVDELPPGVEPTLMDWRPTGLVGAATFLYVVGLPDGRWLLEETALARMPPVSFDDLRQRLAERLGVDLTDTAQRVEHVTIPMATGAPSAGAAIVPFGAAARWVHPGTGYSIADSLAAAPRVAISLATALRRDEVGAALADSMWRAVWPAPQRATRRLHDHGLHALLGLDADVGTFFDAFFDLPVADWLGYLRIDAPPSVISATMWRLFRSVPWSVRGRLAAPRLA